MENVSKFSQARPVEILLVEGNPGDARLTHDALALARVRNRMTLMTTGEEALLYLRQQNQYAGVPRPDLILLDLKLPRQGGYEVLAEIKADERLRQIPVILLTTSESDQDIVKAYGLHTDAYIPKPIDLDRFITVIHSIENFWFSVVAVPGELRLVAEPGNPAGSNGAATHTSHH